MKIASCAIEELFSDMQVQKESLELKNKSKEVKVHKGCKLIEIIG